MRRVTVVTSVVAVVLLGLVAVGRTAYSGAQGGTPAASPAAGPVGVSAVLLGGGQPAAAPGYELTLRRITIAPGGGIPAHTHPGALVIYLESGTWGYTALGGTARLTRAAAAGTPAAAEDLPIGTEVILTAGDVLYVEEPGDAIRNAGDEDVVLLIAGLTRVGEPFTTLTGDMAGMAMGGTPAATPAP